MRCALVVAALTVCPLSATAQQAPQSSGEYGYARAQSSSSALGGPPASFDADPRSRPADSLMTPLVPGRPAPLPPADNLGMRSRSSAIVQTVAENVAGEPSAPPDPSRQAFQAPDIFRTPNPTPLEQVPFPRDGYAPQIAPEQFLPPVAQPMVPEPPLPPFAPLVNVRFTDTWLSGSGDQLGMNDFDVRGTLAMGRTGVFVTPGYGMHFLNGPTQTDLPGTLYDAYVDARWKKQFNPQWGLEFAFTPSFYSDLDNTSSDAYRFITTVLGFYSINPQVQLMAGVMYLDRFDINWFPVFGLICTPGPDSDWRHEFVFPRPKFARRVLRGDDRDAWVYVAGEFGGGAWAVQRANGGDDFVAYRDWRAMLGYEMKVKDYSAVSWFGEAGLVFNRQVEYRSGRGDFDPDSAGMLRLGLSY